MVKPSAVEDCRDPSAYADSSDFSPRRNDTPYWTDTAIFRCRPNRPREARRSGLALVTDGTSRSSGERPLVGDILRPLEASSLRCGLASQQDPDGTSTKSAAFEEPFFRRQRRSSQRDVGCLAAKHVAATAGHLDTSERQTPDHAAQKCSALRAGFDQRRAEIVAAFPRQEHKQRNAGRTSTGADINNHIAGCPTGQLRAGKHSGIGQRQVDQFFQGPRGGQIDAATPAHHFVQVARQTPPRRLRNRSLPERRQHSVDEFVPTCWGWRKGRML